MNLRKWWDNWWIGWLMAWLLSVIFQWFRPHPISWWDIPVDCLLLIVAFAVSTGNRIERTIQKRLDEEAEE